MFILKQKPLRIYLRKHHGCPQKLLQQKSVSEILKKITNGFFRVAFDDFFKKNKKIRISLENLSHTSSDFFSKVAFRNSSREKYLLGFLQILSGEFPQTFLQEFFEVDLHWYLVKHRVG